MEHRLNDFEKAARNITFKAPTLPVISRLLGTCVFDGKTINATYLRRASREPVDFIRALDAAKEVGIVDAQTLWIDLGPHPICASLISKHVEGAKVFPSLKKREDNFRTMADTLASLHLEGVHIRWNEYYAPYERAHRLLSLPAYHWNTKDYWIPYLGTWTLDKALLKHGIDKPSPSLGQNSALRTSSIHQITFEEVGESTGQLKTLSDVAHPDFLSAVQGHRMNNCGVATSSIWCDMAYTAGEYLFRRVNPTSQSVHMNLSDLDVLHATIASRDTTKLQLIALECSLDNASQTMPLAWYHHETNGSRSPEPFATALMRFEQSSSWRKEWSRITHLITNRIASLAQMSRAGAANTSTLSKNMAYTLFKNVVDYAPKYRGMDTVVLSSFEAYADITLSADTHGNWTTPPCWIDSVSHLAGLIMNGSDASNTKDYFFVTPGFGSARLLEPLTPTAKYQSYVHMLPTEDANIRAGDVYILRDGAIVGMVGQIRFKKIPRLLMDQFSSSAPKAAAAPGTAAVNNSGSRPPVTSTSQTCPHPAPPDGGRVGPAPASASDKPPHSTMQAGTPATSAEKDAPAGSSMIDECISLIARETGLDVSDIHDNSSFAELGIDSLMSFVLAEKFRVEMQLDIKSSLFLDCPTAGELKEWLNDYC